MCSTPDTNALRFRSTELAVGEARVGEHLATTFLDSVPFKYCSLPVGTTPSLVFIQATSLLTNCANTPPHNASKSAL